MIITKSILATWKVCIISTRNFIIRNLRSTIVNNPNPTSLTITKAISAMAEVIVGA